MKQKQFMTVHILLTNQSMEEITKFLHSRMMEFQERIERLRALEPFPPAVYNLTNPSDADLVTLGGLLPPTAPSSSHTQTPAATVAVPTPLIPSMDTSHSDFDSGRDSGIDDETAAAADASVGHEPKDRETELEV
jgi:hypothetical protein